MHRWVPSGLHWAPARPPATASRRSKKVGHCVAGHHLYNIRGDLKDHRDHANLGVVANIAMEGRVCESGDDITTRWRCYMWENTP